MKSPALPTRHKAYWSPLAKGEPHLLYFSHSLPTHTGLVFDPPTYWVVPGSLAWCLLVLLFKMYTSQIYMGLNSFLSFGPQFRQETTLCLLLSQSYYFSHTTWLYLIVLFANMHLLWASPLVYKVHELRDWLYWSLLHPQHVKVWLAGWLTMHIMPACLSGTRHLPEPRFWNFFLLKSFF